MARDRRRQRKHGTHGPPFETPERHKLGHIYKQGTRWGNARVHAPHLNNGHLTPRRAGSTAPLSFGPAHIAT